MKERERPARRAELGDAVDDVEGFLVDGHHALGVQLAQRHFQLGPGSGDLVHAVELEVEQFPDPHAGGAQQKQGISAQPVR